MAPCDLRCSTGILGPLLFLAYVIDIADNFVSPVSLFADDCAIIARALTQLTVLPCKETSLDMYSWTPKWQLPSYFSVSERQFASQMKRNHLHMAKA